MEATVRDAPEGMAVKDVRGSSAVLEVRGQRMCFVVWRRAWRSIRPTEWVKVVGGDRANVLASG